MKKYEGPPRFLMSSLSAKGAAITDCDCACVVPLDDCACKVSVQGIITPLQKDALWISAPAAIAHKLTPEESVLHTSHSSRPVVANQRGREILAAFSRPRTWEAAAQEAGPGEREEFLRTAIRLSRAGLLVPYAAHKTKNGTEIQQVLTAWLHLTDRCNLRCEYCYLPHRPEDMSVETGRVALQAIFNAARKNNFAKVKIKYAGGEPLLRFSLLAELHHYAAMLAGNTGLELEEVVLSNGTLLTNEKAAFLRDHKLRLMVSLDGVGHYHDRHRYFATGRGSFSEASRAIELALSQGLKPHISITVTGQTAEGLPALMRWILERELTFSFNFHRANVFSTVAAIQADEQKIIQGMLGAFEVLETHLPRHEFLGGLVDRANLQAAHERPCGVGQNYLVIDPQGRVAKCHMHMWYPVATIFESDPLTKIRDERRDFPNLTIDQKEGCRSCEWKYWCTGGCPLETYRATGRYDVKSPNCNIYKALFPQALRLEGLRLLKYQNDPEVVTRI